MFSGIVETIGKILFIDVDQGCKHFTIASYMPFDDLEIGESIAINGVCLTVTSFTATTFTVTAVPETLRLTNLDYLKIEDLVNLERAMKLSSRLGGHYVQGHVDGIGLILESRHDNSDAVLVKISIPPKLSKYVITKGYIALDGMSITVIESQPEWFTVTFIPHTQQATIVQHYREGSWINLEVDMMGKYIEKLLGAHTHVISH